MTKEMRPAHRIDILTHALLYYGHRTKQKLCEKPTSCPRSTEFFYIVCLTASLLAHRWKKAREINSIAKETLKSLVESLPGGSFAFTIVCMCYVVTWMQCQ